LNNLNRKEIDNIIPFKTDIKNDERNVEIELIAKSPLLEVKNNISNFLLELDVNVNTRKTYFTQLFCYTNYISDHSIFLPKKRDLIAYKNYLIQEKKLSSNSVRINLVVLRMFYKYLHEEGLYEDIARNIKLPIVNLRIKKEPVSLEMVIDILNLNKDDKSIKNLRNRSLAAILICTSLRPISIVRSSFKDLKQMENPDGGASTVLVVSSKNVLGDEIYNVIPQSCLDLLNEYHNARGELQPDAPLFASLSNNNSNGRMTTRSISKIIKSMITGIFKYEKYSHLDLENYCCYSFRHGSINIALQDCKLQIQNIQKNLSFHRDIRVLTNSYVSRNTHLTNSPEEAIAEKIFNKVG